MMANWLTFCYNKGGGGSIFNVDIDPIILLYLTFNDLKVKTNQIFKKGGGWSILNVEI